MLPAACNLACRRRLGLPPPVSFHHCRKPACRCYPAAQIRPHLSMHGSCHVPLLQQE
jgi:hypothetical protein